MIKLWARHLGLAVLLAVSSNAHAKEFENRPAGLRIYTAMNFIPAEREYYGLQIIVISYSEGTKVVWRSGEGSLDVPLLLDVAQDGHSMRVFVPETGARGPWELSIEGVVMHAYGPRGLHFDLQGTPFKNGPR